MMKTLYLFILLLQVVYCKVNKPDGFDRRKYAVEQPKDYIKSINFTLQSGDCRPVYVTENLDGETSGKNNEHLIWYRATSKGWFSFTVSGGLPGEDRQNTNSLTMPKTKHVFGSTWWPNTAMCNINEYEEDVEGVENSTIKILFEYANPASNVTYSNLLLLITIISCFLLVLQ